MRRFQAIFALLVFGSFAQAICPLPQYETCDANRGPNEFQNCLARNRQEDARYKQCRDEEKRERDREEQERREQELKLQEKAREKYCEQYPDSSQCK